MELSLREIKYAKTKFEIVEAAWEHLATESFETCSVKDLCKKVQISEATFFNYFPKKEQLLFFMGQVETTKIVLKADRKIAKSGLEHLRWLVHFIGESMDKNFKPMLEFISTMLRLSGQIEKQRFTPAEMSLFFEPGDPDDFKVRDLGEEIFSDIFQAQQDGNIPPTVNAAEITYSILAMNVGITMVMQMKRVHQCETSPIPVVELTIMDFLKDNLEMILRGIGAKS